MSNIQKPVGEYFSLPFWTKLTSKQAPGGGTRAVMEAAELKTSKQNNKYTGEAVDVLNWCLAATMDWMRANKLKLNPDKTETLLVGGSSDWMAGVQPVLDWVALPLKEQVRSLGVLLEPSLSLEAQVESGGTECFLPTPVGGPATPLSGQG
ncbi:lactosylceramide 4-alpha-galactosyltransferase isoform X3 [Elgaria multicarinata webbii]|uniref:lactosylceramide 4-alpha-galactosyltransferase isoform X3 n=1 Tax=Elgaria multicarinata webbii TaxID=159646 RepID=UPI002FCD05E9